MLLLLAFAPVARAETYDILTFTPPPGTRGAIDDGIVYSETAGKSFFQAAIYKRVEGTGDPAKDFAADWDALVTSVYRVESHADRKTSEAVTRSPHAE